MVKQRAFLLFMAALIMGLAAAWLANNWLQSRLVTSKEETGSTPVVVAAMEISFANKIEGAQLKVINWPSDSVPDGVFNEKSQVEGLIANQKIFPEELILKSRVVEQVSGSTLAAIVTPGMRAVTVRVNDVIGVAGFLLPGNRVDVISTKKNGNRSNADTEIILEDLKVLAVDQTATPDKDKPIVVRAVTLEAEPDDAKKLVNATEEGTVQLALRNPMDESKQVANKVEQEQPVKTVEKVVVKEKPVYIKSKSQEPEAITIIRGTHVDVSKIKL